MRILTRSFLLLSDFDQLPHNVPISATVADIEEKKGFIDYFVSKNKIKKKYHKLLNKQKMTEKEPIRVSVSLPELCD